MEQYAGILRESYLAFRAEIAEGMTDERAEQIRRWRQDEGQTWRYLAGSAAEAWPDWQAIQMADQHTGDVLCQVAEERLGAERWGEG